MSVPEIYVISEVPPVSRADTLSLGSDAGSSEKNISPRVFPHPLILFLSPDPLLPSIAYHVPPNICVHTGHNPGIALD